MMNTGWGQEGLGKTLLGFCLGFHQTLHGMRFFLKSRSMYQLWASQLLLEKSQPNLAQVKKGIHCNMESKSLWLVWLQVSGAEMWWHQDLAYLCPLVWAYSPLCAVCRLSASRFSYFQVQGHWDRVGESLSGDSALIGLVQLQAPLRTNHYGLQDVGLGPLVRQHLCWWCSGWVELPPRTGRLGRREGSLLKWKSEVGSN